MTEQDKERTLLLRKALQKKRAFGLLPVLKEDVLQPIHPDIRTFLRMITDRRSAQAAGGHKDVFIGRNEFGRFLSMSKRMLEDYSDEEYLQTLQDIVNTNRKEGHNEDNYWNRPRLREVGGGNN